MWVDVGTELVLWNVTSRYSSETSSSAVSLHRPSNQNVITSNWTFADFWNITVPTQAIWMFTAFFKALQSLLYFLQDAIDFIILSFLFH
jgi:hypothetical protein